MYVSNIFQQGIIMKCYLLQGFIKFTPMTTFDIYINIFATKKQGKISKNKMERCKDTKKEQHRDTKKQ